MVSILDNGSSISVWVLSFFVFALTIAFGLTLRSWREARRSPYFFQRREALQQMQSYTLATMAILIAAASVAAYAYSPSLAATPRVKVITYAKPQFTQQETAREAIQERIEQVQQQDVAIEAVAASSVIEREVVVESVDEDVDSAEIAAIEAQPEEEAVVEVEAVVEEEIAAVETVEVAEDVVSADASINSIQFARNIDQNYAPIGAGVEFAEGNYKIYATFNYDNIPTGAEWKWVWKHNGVVVGQDTVEWYYGESGPGWVFFSPESGFSPGTYSLEMWLDGIVVTQGNMNVSANVANQ